MLAGPVTGGVPAGAPFLFYIEIYEVIRVPKPFLTYEQQMQKLKDKHLVIPNEAEAIEMLRLNGYFALITGYKSLFKNPTTKDYRDGTTFDDIVALYEFDEQLRELTLRHLLHIERHIRSALSYAFCQKHGEQQSAYLDSNNYDLHPRNNAYQVNKLITRYLKPLLDKPTEHLYIEHYKKQHQNVPLWVLINALTFGTISKMYQYSTSDIQAFISKEFEGINEGQLRQILQVLTDFRNVCAHNERLFSYRCSQHEIPNLPLHKKLNIPMRGTQYLYGKRDFFAVFLAFRYLLPNKEFIEYKRHLGQLINKAVSTNHQITEAELLHLMGFPQNWKKVTAYRKV